MGVILLKDKQARIFLLLKNVQQPWYLATLAKASDSTYVHTSNFIKKCEQMGLTANEKHGKIKEIKLTEKGMRLADALGTVYTIISQLPQQSAPQPKQSEEPKPQPPQPEKQEKK